MARLISLAKWTKDTGVPIDVAWLEAQGVASTPITPTTPAITVSRQAEKGEWVRTISLYGGVGLRFENEYISPSDKEGTLWSQTLADRPSPVALSWSFEVGDEQYRAVAVSPSKKPVVGGYLGPVVIDLEIPGKPSLPFSRRYDSTNLDPGLLGRGWAIDLPYLRFSSPTEEYSLDDGETWIPVYPYGILWIDPLSGRQTRYRDHRFSYDSRVIYTSDELGDAPELIREADGRYTLERSGGPNLMFDAAGQLLARESLDRDSVRYSYVDGQLASMENVTGGKVEFVYNDLGLIEEAKASTGEIRRYTYNDWGDLANVADGEGNILASYEYDLWHRLVLEKDGQGNVVRWNAYDDLNRLVAWGDAQGRYRVSLGPEEITVAYQANEGPILSQGDRPSDDFLQMPGVQAFLAETGESFLPDLGAYEKLLRDDVALLYIARSGGQVHLLFDGHYAQSGEDALVRADELEKALTRTGVSLPDDRPVLVTGKGSWNQDFYVAFPGHTVLHAEGLDAAMISRNLQYVLKAAPLTLDKTAIYLGIPKDEQELEAIGKSRDNWRGWASIAARWEKLVTDMEFGVAPRGVSMDQQVQQSLQEMDNVVIVVAHSDGEKIYLPDGTQLTPREWNEALRAHPLVILVSCETGSVTQVSSLAKTLLDKGARTVAAPDKEVYVNDDALLYYLLGFSREAAPEEGGFLEVWLRAIEKSGARYFRLLIGRNEKSAPAYC